MSNMSKFLRKQPTLPSKPSILKLGIDTAMIRDGILRVLGTSSARGDSDKDSIGKSEPGRKAGTRSKNGSSMTSGSDQEKPLGSIANSHVIKYFGPLFEQYRKLKSDMEFSLLGPKASFRTNNN